MPAVVLLLGVSIFSLCLVGHIIVWRFHRPRHDARVLFALFFMGGIALLSGFFGSLSGTDWMANVLLHVAMSCGYIQLYPASQANSPSVTILKAVSQSMPHGMNEAEIRSLLDLEKNFQERIEDLLVSGLMIRENGRLSLTKRGRAFIVPFIYYRRMLGIPEGKG